MGAPLELREADRVEVVSLVDNSIDVLSTSPREEVRRLRDWVERPKGHPSAEHGFSMLVRVYGGGESHAVLFDAGSSPRGVVANARRMGVDLRDVECVVLSHGHYDHFAGLRAVAEAVGRAGLPVLVHGDMFKRRGVEGPDGVVREYRSLPPEGEVRPARYVEAAGPQLVAGGLALITGEIPRATSFEAGFPQHRAFVNGRWEPEPWIRDERALVINVRRRGLVVLSGCGHAGIVNTVLHAQRLTGVERVYAILGGLHLAGSGFEERIAPTVEELKRLGPRVVAPSHCTGWRACCALYRAMPDSFVWGSVGNLYVL